MRRATVAAGVAALIAAMSGCGFPVESRDEALAFNPDALPGCVPQGSNFNGTVVLMAQAVPTASLLPCVRGLPVGWNLAGLDISDGRAEFWFNSDREGNRALTIQLTESCAMGPATRIPSTRTEVQRWESVTRVTDGYGGLRYFVYDGGCTTYTFDLHGESRAQPLAALSAAFDFVDRDEVAQQVEEWSDGKVQLDPATTR
jgi:hypothetical protein